MELICSEKGEPSVVLPSCTPYYYHRIASASFFLWTVEGKDRVYILTLNSNYNSKEIQFSDDYVCIEEKSAWMMRYWVLKEESVLGYLSERLSLCSETDGISFLILPCLRLDTATRTDAEKIDNLVLLRRYAPRCRVSKRMLLSRVYNLVSCLSVVPPSIDYLILSSLLLLQSWFSSKPSVYLCVLWNQSIAMTWGMWHVLQRRFHL
jgi:hypothetical protein